jgi:hypothetical protein
LLFLNDAIWPQASRTNGRCSILADNLVIEGDVTSGSPVDVQGNVVGFARSPAYTPDLGTIIWEHG